MEIKVIGVGPNVAAEAKKIEEAILKHLGIAPGEEKTAEIKGGNPVEALMEAIKIAEKENERAQLRRAKNILRNAIDVMREDGIDIEIASLALAEATCIFCNGNLKPVDGKTAKEAFTDFIGEVFDVADKKVAKIRAENEGVCRGR